MPAYRSKSGFTLIEMVVTVAVLSILLVLAVPSFRDMLAKRRLTGATEQLYADLQYARGAAIKSNRNVQVYFTTGTSWCYGLDDNTNDVCNCSTNPGFCTIDGVQKVVTSSGFKNVSLATSENYNLIFTPRRGEATAGNARFTTNDREARLVVSDTGRIRLCSILQTDANYLGYPQC